MAAVRVAVRDALADLGSGAVVLVGCSGGPDSMALAAATAHLARRAGWRAGAVVVDHGTVSPQVAQNAGRWCTGLGLTPVDVRRVHLRPSGDGPEATARDARYAAFEESVSRHRADALLLGHTLDDQAEQVLLGLVRGSGARSLAGMPARRGPYRRPLLAVPRDTLRQAVADEDLPVWHDPSNTDLTLTRNRIRHDLLPALEAGLGPGISAALARTAAQLAEDDEVLSGLARELLARATRPGPPTRPGEQAAGPALDVTELSAAPAAIRRRCLRQVLAGPAPAGRLTRRHLLAVDALVTDWRGQGPTMLPGGVHVRREDGMLVLTRVPGTS